MLCVVPEVTRIAGLQSGTSKNLNGAHFVSVGWYEKYNSLIIKRPNNDYTITKSNKRLKFKISWRT